MAMRRPTVGQFVRGLLVCCLLVVAAGHATAIDDFGDAGPF
jgi:hypothetical protein